MCVYVYNPHTNNRTPLNRSIDYISWLAFCDNHWDNIRWRWRITFFAIVTSLTPLL